MSDQNGLTVADIEQIETWAAEVTKPSSREAINYCPNLNPQTILALCAAARRGIGQDAVLADIANRAVRIRESNAVVGVEAAYIERIARAALSADPVKPVAQSEEK